MFFTRTGKKPNSTVIPDADPGSPETQRSALNNTGVLVLLKAKIISNARQNREDGDLFYFHIDGLSHRSA